MFADDRSRAIFTNMKPPPQGQSVAGSGRRPQRSSVGFPSQIERGLSSPSLRVLATRAGIFGVGIAALFGPEDWR
jgi:hypothetical protein